MEHGNAARPPGSRRADLTARRVKGSSIRMTEEANAGDNAPDIAHVGHGLSWQENKQNHREEGKANDSSTRN